MASNDKNTKKETWTVMVFLAGDNNLSDECLWAIKEMKRARVDGNINVIAQFDSRGEGIPTQRYIIHKVGQANRAVLGGDEEDGTLSSKALTVNRKPKKPKTPAVAYKAKTPGPATDSDFPEFLASISYDPEYAQKCLKKSHTRRAEEIGVLKDEDPGAENTGNPWTLLKFIDWGIEEFPADHYMVVLSGHGAGAEEDFFLRDASSRDSLTIRELEQVFEVVKAKLKGKLDILGMDSCLMSMAEVYYQLRDTIDFLVGAEGFEPGTGWPYQRILEAMADSISKSRDSKPKELVREIASTVVDKYVLYYFDYALAGRSVELSACDVNESDKLKGVVSKLSEALQKALKDELERESKNEGPTFCPIRDAVVLAHWYAQTYMFDQYVDLYDFCDLLQIRSEAEDKNYFREIKKCCGAVKEAIQPANSNGAKGIVVNSWYSGPAFQHSHGLSVYFPWAHVSDEYRRLAFANATGWDEFLNVYVNSTRRKPRGTCEPARRGSIEEKLFNPDKFNPDELGKVKFTEGVDKFTEGVDKFTEGVDKGLAGIVGYTKNPPQNWCGEQVKEKVTATGPGGGTKAKKLRRRTKP